MVAAVQSGGCDDVSGDEPGVVLFNWVRVVFLGVLRGRGKWMSRTWRMGMRCADGDGIGGVRCAVDFA